MKLLKKIIVRNLDMEYTNDVEFLSKYLSGSNKIHFITGKAKVGKTTFFLKFIRQIIQDSNYTAKILFMSLDERAWYWTHILSQTLEEKDPGIFANVKFVRICSARGALKMVVESVKHHTDSAAWDFVFIDGIDYELEGTGTFTLWRLKKQLIWIKKKKQFPLYVAYREKKSVYMRKARFCSRKTNLVYLHLEKPGYIDADIKVFGDTNLFIAPGKHSYTNRD